MAVNNKDSQFLETPMTSNDTFSVRCGPCANLEGVFIFLPNCVTAEKAYVGVICTRASLQCSITAISCFVLLCVNNTEL